MFIVPYMVVAAVAILFFIVCRFMVYGIGGKSRHAGVKAEVTAKISVRPRRKKVPVRQAVPETTAEFPLRKKSAGAGKSAGETTQVLPVKEIIKKADAAMGADGATRVFDRGELEKTLPPAKMPSGKVSAFTAEKAPEILEGTPTLQSLEERFVRHFLNRYGAVSSVVEQDTRMVTGHLIRNMDMDPEDMADSLTHIMVQEALQNAQRTYVLMPNDTVLSMVTDAFADVARGRRSETRTTLAYDALKATLGGILPRQILRCRSFFFFTIQEIRIMWIWKPSASIQGSTLLRFSKSCLMNTAVISRWNIFAACLWKTGKSLLAGCFMIHTLLFLLTAAP